MIFRTCDIWYPNITISSSTTRSGACVCGCRTLSPVRENTTDHKTRRRKESSGHNTNKATKQRSKSRNETQLRSNTKAHTITATLHSNQSESSVVPLSSRWTRILDCCIRSKTSTPTTAPATSVVAASTLHRSHEPRALFFRQPLVWVTAIITWHNRLHYKINANPHRRNRVGE